MATHPTMQNTLTTQTKIPGPPGQFLLGSIQDFRRDQLGVVQRMASEYGPVARFRLGAVAERPMLIQPTVTLRPKDGIWMKASRGSL